jgi:hypothetical protein
MSKLIQIAAQMRQYAIAHPRRSTTADVTPYRRKLDGGLGLVLYLDIYHTWRLSLYRAGVFPSPAEVQVIRRDFNVPADVGETRRQIDQWRIINLEWSEPSQKKLFDIEPASRPDNYYQSS